MSPAKSDRGKSLLFRERAQTLNKSGLVLKGGKTAQRDPGGEKTGDMPWAQVPTELCSQQQGTMALLLRRKWLCGGGLPDRPCDEEDVQGHVCLMESLSNSVCFALALPLNPSGNASGLRALPERSV